MLDGFHRKKRWLRLVLAHIALAMPASFANLTLEWPYNNHKRGIYLSAFLPHSSKIRAGLNLGCENNCSGYFSVIKIMIVSRHPYLSLASYFDPETSVLASDVVAPCPFTDGHSAKSRLPY